MAKRTTRIDVTLRERACEQAHESWIAFESDFRSIAGKIGNHARKHDLVARTLFGYDKHSLAESGLFFEPECKAVGIGRYAGQGPKSRRQPAVFRIFPASRKPSQGEVSAGAR